MRPQPTTAADGQTRQAGHERPARARVLDFFVTASIMLRVPDLLSSAPSPASRRVRVAGLLGCSFAFAFQASAQTADGRLGQDELDLQGRSSVVQGSGARAFGMGGAFLARPDDATAVSWNPAGLSYLRRPELSLVRLAKNSLDSRETSWQSPDATLLDQRNGSGFDFFAATHPVTLGTVSGAVQVSYQRVLAFDSRRTIVRSNGTVTIDSDGGFDLLAVASGLQVSRHWRVGATLNRWFNGYDQALDRQTAVTSQQELGFDVSAWNVNLGLIWSPSETLNVGAVVKSPFTAQVAMARVRRDVVDAAGQEFITTNSYASDRVRLYLPGALGVGVSWRPRSTLTLSVDYTRSLWSEAYVRDFFTLAACQPGQTCPPARQPEATSDLFPTLTYPSLADPRQSDTEEIRLGIERVLLFERAKLPLRLGLFSDRQYFLRGDGTPPRSVGFTAGVGVGVGPLLLDAAYVREVLSYGNRALNEDDQRRVSSVSEKVYFSLIVRVP